jgi:mannose/cellobiose epimerase-like protein (N-acyl-D-glucosamine 2-epimerase family)
MTNESSAIASIHDRICFKTNRSLALGVGVVALAESLFKVTAYARNKAVTPLSTFEWVALAVAFVFFVLMSASARCKAERIVTILFALGVAADLARGVATYWPTLSGVIAHYRLWSTVIWISTALISLAAGLVGRKEQDR